MSNQEQKRRLSVSGESSSRLTETCRKEGIANLRTRSTSPIDSRIVRLVLGETIQCTTASNIDGIGVGVGYHDRFRDVPDQLENELFSSEIERSSTGSLLVSMAKAIKSVQKAVNVDKKQSYRSGRAKTINHADKSPKKRDKVFKETYLSKLNGPEDSDQNRSPNLMPKFSSRDQVMDLILSKIQVSSHSLVISPNSTSQQHCQLNPRPFSQLSSKF
jgi:hypothetical protein